VFEVDFGYRNQHPQGLWNHFDLDRLYPDELTVGTDLEVPIGCNRDPSTFPDLHFRNVDMVPREDLRQVPQEAGPSQVLDGNDRQSSVEGRG